MHENVTQLKKSRQWEERYMRFEELLNDARREGEEEGEKRGEERGQDRILQLMDVMIQSGEEYLLPRLRQEPDFLKSMLEKYHL